MDSLLKKQDVIKYDSEKHNRRSIRLEGYDYTKSGFYFVTICTYNNECVFGEIIDGEMRLNKYGKIVSKSWKRLEKQYTYIKIDTMIVMPNHLHSIIIINNNDDVICEGGSRTAPTKRKPLGRLIGAFKTVSTKQINAIRQTVGITVWQRNFYEHIIRNEKELNEIREYIINNSLKWEFDEENAINWGENI